MQKKIIFLFALLAVVATGAFGQARTTIGFVPVSASASSLQPVKIGEKNSIIAYLLPGKMGEDKAYGISFRNGNTGPVSFSWTIKDKNGKVVSASSVSLNAGQTLYPMNAAAESKLAFTSTGDMQPNDYTIEITIK